MASFHSSYQCLGEGEKRRDRGGDLFRFFTHLLDVKHPESIDVPFPSPCKAPHPAEFVPLLPVCHRHSSWIIFKWRGRVTKRKKRTRGQRWRMVAHPSSLPLPPSSWITSWITSHAWRAVVHDWLCGSSVRALRPLLGSSPAPCHILASLGRPLAPHTLLLPADTPARARPQASTRAPGNTVHCLLAPVGEPPAW